MNKKFILILPISFFVIFWLLFFVFLFEGLYNFVYNKNIVLIEAELKKYKNIKEIRIYWADENEIFADLIIDNKYKIDLKYLTLSQFKKAKSIYLSRVNMWNLYLISYDKKLRNNKIEIWPQINIVKSGVFINKKINNINDLIINFDDVYGFIEKIPVFKIDDLKVKDNQYWNAIPDEFYYKDEGYEYKIIKYCACPL